MESLLDLIVWHVTASFSNLLKLSLFASVVIGRVLTGAWFLKPFLVLSSVTLSVTLIIILDQELNFQQT